MLLGRAAPEICVCSRERKLGAYGAYMDPSSLQEPPLMTALKETRAYIGPLRGKMGDPSRGADGICASSRRDAPRTDSVAPPLILLTLDYTPECILGPWRASRTAYKQLFRLANSQDALLSVSMPFDSMSDASSCHQPPAAQAAFAFTPPTPSSAYALCGGCRVWVFPCTRSRS